MNESTRHDALLEKDWGEGWDDLAPAPPLVHAKPKTAQLTLRVPRSLISALKAVAGSKSLPYHALARSWILEGLQSGRMPETPGDVLAEDGPPSSEQLNLKVEPEILDRLKQLSHETRRPYHQLARQWVEAGVTRERPVASAGHRPALRELMMLLLDGDQSGTSAVRGMTRLQKLLFVIQQELDRDSSTFYAWNYGPFDEKVIDSAEALRVNGFLAGSTSASTSTLPSFDQMLATVMDRAEPRTERDAEVFELNESGREAAERLRRSSAAYERLHLRVQEIRREWDSPNLHELVERVYDAYPEQTHRSVIKREVDRRRARRQS
jgi:hypothetical protein